LPLLKFQPSYVRCLVRHGIVSREERTDQFLIPLTWVNMRAGRSTRIYLLWKWGKRHRYALSALFPKQSPYLAVPCLLVIWQQDSESGCKCF